MRISDWSSDVCSSDLLAVAARVGRTACLVVAAVLERGGGGIADGIGRGPRVAIEGVLQHPRKILGPQRRIVAGGRSAGGGNRWIERTDLHRKPPVSGKSKQAAGQLRDCR